MQQEEGLMHNDSNQDNNRLHHFFAKRKQRLGSSPMARCIDSDVPEDWKDLILPESASARILSKRPIVRKRVVVGIRVVDGIVDMECQAPNGS
jgi:hypothetical protein